jgi:hypothetical protein
VSRFLAVTDAADNAAPEGSVMSPDKLADTWAAENGAHKKEKSHAKIVRSKIQIPPATLGAAMRDPSRIVGGPDRSAQRRILLLPRNVI